jgi:hypothetical protein
MSRNGIFVALLVLLIGLGACVLLWHDQRINATHEQVVATTQAPVAEEVLELPEDGQVYHISVMVHDDWRARGGERRLVAWWQVHPALVSLKAGTHFHVYTESDRVYQTKLKHACPTLPAVIIQDANGKVHFKCSGENTPQDSQALVGALGRTFRRRPIYIFPWRRPCPCPHPDPSPQPDPQPKPTPDDEVDVDVNIADTVTQPEIARPPFPWLLLIIVLVITAVITLWVHLQRRMA